MTKEELLDSCIGYLAELWERDDDEEWNIHWQNIIGMSEDDMGEYGLSRE